jgi:hypothetical protein
LYYKKRPIETLSQKELNKQQEHFRLKPFNCERNSDVPAIWLIECLDMMNATGLV